MLPDEQTLSACLEQYLQARLREIPRAEAKSRASASGERVNPDGGRRLESAAEESRKRAERYQYAVWRIKDRLSYGFFGASSERLADDFLTRFGIETEKGTEEYYRILRRVLQTEMDCYSILIRQEDGDPDSVREYYRRLLTKPKKPGTSS